MFDSQQTKEYIAMEKTLIFNSRDELLRVQLSRIVYIESDGNYTTLTLSNRDKHLLGINLTAFQKLIESQLGPSAEQFIRIGKSLIINREYIYCINLIKQKLILAGADFEHTFTIPASKESLKSLKALLVAIYQSKKEV
jgi:DNA-binding LytR/AlgR family response regulator